MRIILYFTSLTLTLFFSHFSRAQGIQLPTSTILFEHFEAFSNASLLETNSDISIGTQGQFGAFSEIRTLYGFGSIPFKEHRNGLGLSVYSFQEGELISENRLKINYWKKITLRDSIQLIAGGQAGFINTRYEATRSTAGASNIIPDFDFGFTLKLANSSFSAAINQLTNPENTPLTQVNIFSTFYSFLIQHDYQVSHLSKLRFYGHSRITKTIKNVIQFKIKYFYNNRYTLGIGAGTEGVLFSAGANKFISNYPLSLDFGYRFSVANNTSNNFTPYQLHLSYNFDN